MHKFCLLVVLLGFASTAHARAADNVPANLDAQAIRAQQAVIRSEVLAGGGRYAKLDARDRDDLLRHQDRLATLLRKVDNTSSLPERRQIDVFNTLEAISAIVNFDPDGRTICRRERPIGSNRPLTSCMTVAQMREEREVSQSEMQRRGLL